MGYPQRLLGDDEHVELDLHPHWINLVLPVGAAVVILAAAAVGVSAVPSGSTGGAAQIAIGVVALILLWFTTVRAWLRWITTSYVVTSERVVVREGILSRTGRDIPLQRMNDVTFHHTFFERIIGSGTLTIESAGERGQVVLRDVPRVEYVQSTLYRLTEEDDIRRRRLGATAEAEED
ncbi:MAG: PH domain-containing protein [Frankia sp.]